MRVVRSLAVDVLSHDEQSGGAPKLLDSSRIGRDVLDGGNLINGHEGCAIRCFSSGESLRCWLRSKGKRVALVKLHALNGAEAAHRKTKSRLAVPSLSR